MVAQSRSNHQQIMKLVITIQLDQIQLHCVGATHTHDDSDLSIDTFVRDTVDVASETGVMKELILAEYNIKPGNVMTYMPEANILIPQNADERSRTPSFKSVSVTIKNH